MFNLRKQNRPFKSTGAILCLCTAFILTACGLNLSGEPEIVATLPPPPTPMPTPDDLGYPQQPPDIQRGAAIFAENCTRCHGIDGKGNGELVQNGQVPYPGDMTDFSVVSLKTPQQWFTTITQGNLENLMPPWGNTLNEEDRWAVAHYTYTLGYSVEQIERGEEVYVTYCAECHGETGAGGGTRAIEESLDVGELNNPRKMITLGDDAIYVIIAEGADDMPAYGEELTPDQIRDAVVYTRNLSVSNLTSREQVIPQPDETEEVSQQEPQEPVIGQIRGDVTNGTAGSNVPDGAVVQLFIFDDQFTQIDTLETTVENGSYTFADVSINPAYAYITGVIYRDRQFISEPVTGATPSEDGTLSMPVTIYELTEDPAVIQIERMVVQISAMGDGLQIAEVVFFNNTSDRLFTSSTPLNEDGDLFGSTVLSLPPGAIVAGLGGNPERYIISEENFTVVDTQPVLPGDGHTMQVVYFLPYEDEAIIEHPFNYVFEGMARVLVRPTDLQLNSAQLEQLGEATIGANTYSEYGATLSLPTGGTLRYDLRGRVNASGTATGTQTGQWLPTLLFVLAGICGLAALALFVFSRMNTGQQQRSREIDRLLVQIAELDNAHEAGRLNHDVWHKQRKELKERLRILMEEDKPE